MASGSAHDNVATIHCTATPYTLTTYRFFMHRYTKAAINTTFFMNVAQFDNWMASPKHPQSATASVIASHSVNGSNTAIMAMRANGATRR